MQYANQYPSNQMIRNNYATPAPQNNNFIMSNNNFLKGKPVASIEEARATSIDFDGSIFYFPDAANQTIYTKQINLDGTASINMYVLQEIPQTANPQTTQNLQNLFVSKQEFQQTITSLLEEMGKMKGDKINEQQQQLVPDAPTIKF